MWGAMRVSDSGLNSDGDVVLVGGSNAQYSLSGVFLSVCITVADEIFWIWGRLASTIIAINENHRCKCIVMAKLRFLERNFRDISDLGGPFLFARYLSWSVRHRVSRVLPKTQKALKAQLELTS